MTIFLILIGTLIWLETRVIVFELGQNIVGRGQNAVLFKQSSHRSSSVIKTWACLLKDYQPFLLPLQCLESLHIQGDQNLGLSGTVLSLFSPFTAIFSMAFFWASELFTTQSPVLMTLMERTFENIVGKGENAGNQCFLPFLQQVFNFEPHSIRSLQMLSIWTSLRFCRL